MNYFTPNSTCAEHETTMATLTDYFHSVSTEDYVVAGSFASTESGEKMVKRVTHPVGRPRKRPLELSEAQERESTQVAPALADSKEPTSAKSIQCQYTAKRKQCIVLYTRDTSLCSANVWPSVFIILK